MKLEVRNLHGDTYSFEIDETETVRKLKEKIAETVGLKEKYNADLLKILCSGKVTEDEEALNTLTIDPNGGFLVLVKQTPGKTKPPPKKKTLPNFSKFGMNGFNSSFGMSPMSNSMFSQALSPDSMMNYSGASNGYMSAGFQQPLSMQQPFAMQQSSSQSFSSATLPSQGSLLGLGSTDNSLNLTGDTFAVNEDHTDAIEQLVQMGFERKTSEKVLRDCRYNVTAAVDLLTSGYIPPEDDFSIPSFTGGSLPPTLTLPPVPTVAPSPPVPQPQPQLQPQPQPQPPSADAGLNLQALGQSLEQNPGQLAEIKERLKVTHPEIAQLIEDDPQAFLELLRQAGNEDDSSENINTNNTSTNNPNPQPVVLSAQEQQIINRIEEMGFPRDSVIEAFLASGRNEEMAVHYLLHSFA